MPKRSTGNTKIQVMIPPRLLRGLKLLAEDGGTTVSQLVREGVELKLKAQLPRLKELLGR